MTSEPVEAAKSGLSRSSVVLLLVLAGMVLFAGIVAALLLSATQLSPSTPPPVPAMPVALPATPPDLPPTPTALPPGAGSGSPTR